jgi:hypothetical protein
MVTSAILRGSRCLACAAAVAAGSSGTVPAADVTRPAEVAGLVAAHNGDDVDFAWTPVTLDAAGNAETVDHYRVYRAEAPDFVPDKAGGANRIGTSATAEFTDVDAATNAATYFYLVSAVDADGNESDTKTPLVAAPPVLSGFWTDTTIEVAWTPAEPSGEVVGYKVYYGNASGQYLFADDVGLVTSHSLTGLAKFVNWYVAVTAVDANGNESAFSNEHVDAVAGVVRLKAHDEEELCWGAANCPPGPGRIQRNDGWQILVPVAFPEGDWTRITVTYTLDSRLCTPPAQGTTTKCGDTNPGGYNPCGDPWDRIAHLFLVLDDCIEAGGSCVTNDNLELMRAITPFGTDAEPPDGTGVVPPRKLTLDITPFAPLLTGTRYLGADIVHFVQAGWWVSVDFTFSERPESASPKPPAAGFQIVGFAGAPLPTRQVTIPPEATSVVARVFTTGHGGSLFCDGGPNNALPCTVQAQCPGGVCNPCDEFCHRTNRLIVDGTPAWQFQPWRSDCSPGPSCSTWNACGFPSCTFPRAGWCPGYIACHQNPPCDQDIDVTGALAPGGTYDVDYDVVPMNGSWPVSVVVYWYE